MNPDPMASTVEELQQEVVRLTQLNTELQRLASFPEHNPIPIFEFNLAGQLVYLNPAAQQIMSKLGLNDASLFLPSDFSELSKRIKKTKLLQASKTIRVSSCTFEETIIYSKEYNSVRIYASDVTKHLKVERALHRSRQEQVQTQEFIEAATKGTNVLIAAIDAKFRYTYFNQAYQEEVKRLSGEEISIGMNMLDAFAHQPEQQQVVEREWSQVLHGETTNKILDFGDPTRYHKVYNVFHTPIWDEKHRVVGAGEVAYDITEQVHNQETLQENEKQFRSLFEQMNEGFAVHEMIFDENGNPYDYRFLEVNPAFERLTGLKREYIIGKTYREILPDEGESWVNSYGKVVLTGEPLQLEDFSPTLGKHFEVFAYRNAPNQFAVLFLDVTKRKQMQEDLRTNLTKYRVLFDTLPLGVTVTDKNGQIIESNQEATQLLSLSMEEQKQRLIQSEAWKIVRPDRSPMPVDEFASVRAMQEQRRIEDVEMGVVKENDQITWISVSAAPLPLKDYGIVIAYNNVTRRFLAEEALHRAHLELEKTVQERTQELVEANRELQAEIQERIHMTDQLAVQTQAVEAQRQRFNDVLEILPVYLILLTPDYHVAFANRYFRQRFGEDHGRRCYEYLFDRDAPCENCETYKVFQTNHEHNWEWLGPDNKNYDVYDFPFQDVDGSTLILEMGIDITRRKQAEENLRQLNAYNRSLLESSPDILATITPDGKIGDVNAATESATGYSRQELIGTDFSTYFTNPERARQGYLQVFATGKVHDFELELQHKDGHITPVVYNAALYRDEHGNVAGVYAAAHDITKRKRTERRLVLLNTALESAANAIIITDKDGSILWSNPSFSRATGYSKEEIVGLTPRFLKSGKQDNEFYKSLWDTILSGKVWHGELLNRRKDDSLYYEDQVITPVFDANGSITNFISIRQDITEHKQAEDAMMKSEQLYRSLVIASSQIVWQTDATGDTVEDNPMWRAFTGQSESEFLGRGWRNAIHPQDQHRINQKWEEALQNKSIFEVECLIKNRYDEYENYSVKGVPINDKDGNIISWVGTCSNITEKKNYEMQLIQAEKHAVIGRMVGSVTHEINNPLQTIKNCLYLIQQETESNSPNQEPLGMALSETQRLSNIVGQLRQLYRPQAGQTMSRQDLLDLLNEVKGLITPHLKNSRVSWKPMPGLSHYSVNGVKDQLIEVFLNICTNAIEAMQPGGGELSVDMVLSSRKDQVGVVIGDSGPGVDKEILPHLFEPFVTSKEYGLGLGLSICYEIIEKHGGQITVESKTGRGTSFTVWLPIIAGRKTRRGG
jgi:nitrogen fixation negative regulator NifL